MSLLVGGVTPLSDAPLAASACGGSQLAAFMALLVRVVNASQEGERGRRAAQAGTWPSFRPQDADVVVVGGGTAGCVLAARLSEGGRRRVLLLERGGTEPPQARVPGFTAAMFETDLVQVIQSEAEPQSCNGTGCTLQLPRVLGGGSAVNGLLYARGNDRDFDQWAELVGDDGWNASNVLRYFKKAEDNLDIAINWDTDYHARGGPQKVSWEPYRHPVLHRAAKAFDALGVPFLLDFNAGRGQLGYAVAQTLTAGGERWSTYRSYLLPAMRRPNLRVETFASARRVLFDQTAGGRPKASGVEYLDAAGQSRVVRAKEVVLAAGAIFTPQVLIMSGIGPEEHLKELGVPKVADLPVGEALMDHPRLTGLVLTCEPPLCQTDWQLHRRDLREYECNRTGALTEGFLQMISFQKANLTGEDPQDPQPDFQFFFKGTLLDNSPQQCRAGDSWRLNSITATPAVLHPRSVGSVRLNVSAPWAAPLVRLGYFTDAAGRDLDVALRGLRLALRLAEPLEDMGLRLQRDTSADGCGGETLPFGSDAHLECLARRATATMWHWAGTCRMARQGAEGVLDAALRVRGVDGLRVADASAMPGLTSGNIVAPVIMLAERAADLIRSDWN